MNSLHNKRRSGPWMAMIQLKDAKQQSSGLNLIPVKIEIDPWEGDNDNKAPWPKALRGRLIGVPDPSLPYRFLLRLGTATLFHGVRTGVENGFKLTLDQEQSVSEIPRELM